MSIILSSSATNNSDWKTQFQFTDGDTGNLIDFTGAVIEIEVRDHERCRRIVASTGNGLIAIISLGIFELDIPATQMRCLCAGSYQVGGVYSLNGETISLFTGSLAVIDGGSRI